MQIAGKIPGWIAGMAVLFACSARAAELPPPDMLRRQMGTLPQTVAVYEPHLSVGDRHVAIRYVGYPAVEAFQRILGKDWRRQGETVEFRALDGYVSRLPVGRFEREKAYLVFARKDGAPFTVTNIRQNEKDVPSRPTIWSGTISRTRPYWRKARGTGPIR